MKPVKTINDPESFQLIADETRRKMLFLLRVKEMTVSQMAETLNITPQAVYYHVKKLVNAGMVEVSREVRVDHLIESYYRATAETFNCHVGPVKTGTPEAKDHYVTVFNALKSLGFNITPDDERIKRIMAITDQMSKCLETGKIEDKVAELENIDFVTKQTVIEFAEMLSMTDDEFRKNQELEREFRGVLKSMLKP